MNHRIESLRINPLGLSPSRMACVTSALPEDIREAIADKLSLDGVRLSNDTYGYPVYRIQAVALTRIARKIDPACSIHVLPVRHSWS